MSVEPGQLRVWDDTITYDKTPFLVIERVVYPETVFPCTDGGDWRVLWLGKIATWSAHRMESFSEVLDA